MKRLLTVLLAILIVLSLGACSKGDAAKKYPIDYGTYEITTLKSLDGSISDEAFAAALEQMKDSNQLFYFEFGDKSYMYGPDGNGGYGQYEVEFDFDKSVIRQAGTDYTIDFTVENGGFYIDEASSGVRFILSKTK